MKILIVDDEERTREGLATQIDWKGLGFDQVLLAADGIEGIELALTHRPEVLLCDVRMPRLDGIEMVTRLNSQLPDLVPIFMSGYSDKEYLKAAIRLGAVNYVEKPLDEGEIIEAVTKAVAVSQLNRRRKQGERLQSRQTEEELVRLSISSRGPSTPERQLSLLRDLGYSGPPPRVTCFLVRVSSEDLLPSPEDIASRLLPSLTQRHHLLATARHREQNLVLVLFTESPLSEGTLSRLRHALEEVCRDAGPHYLSQGRPNLPLENAYDSYSSAVIRLQNAYFFPEGSFLYERDGLEYPLSPAQNAGRGEKTGSLEAMYQASLSSGKEKETMALLEELYGRYAGNREAIPSQVLDLYYNLLRLLRRSCSREGLLEGDLPESLLQSVQRHFSFASLHEDLAQRTRTFFAATASASLESAAVRHMKSFLQANYSNAALSVKDIGDHVGLSASYVCTVFKNETGQTLNQYLTTLRMEKAKLLLADPATRIGEISAQVGYLDGSYFGKSFKRYTGYSPSEYRERCQEV